MRTLAKNAPCPCESGRSFRECHLPRDEQSRREDRARGNARDAIHTLEAVTCERLLEFIDDELDLDPFESCPVPRDDEGIARTWAAYDAGHIDLFLARHGGDIASVQRDWIEAQRHARVGFWAVDAIEPGRTLFLRNRLTGERQAVFERLETRRGPVGRHLFARVVSFGEHAYLSGALSPSVAPEDASGVLARLRALLFSRAGVPLSGSVFPEKLTEMSVRWEFWRMARETMYRPSAAEAA